MGAMNPSVLQAVVRPHRMWRRLGAGAKFAVYTRLSVQTAIVGLGVGVVMLFLFGRRSPDVTTTAWQAALVTVLAVSLTAVSVAVTESRPEFTTVARTPRPQLVVVGVVLSAVVYVAGLLMYVRGDGGVALTGTFLVMLFFVLAPIGVLPWIPYRWPVALVLTVVASIVMWSSLAWFPAFFGTFMLGTTAVSAWTVDLAKQLDRARVAESALQVSEERLRFSQELHDTLGQRLAAMSVKAELARALVKRGDGRADAELAELQELARASVTEMHEVVEGYRAMNLSTEVEGPVSCWTAPGCGWRSPASRRRCPRPCVMWRRGWCGRGRRT